MSSIDISPELLAEVERLGAAAFSPTQVAFILGIKPGLFKDCIKDEDHELSIAYYKGFFTSELSVRESILLLARNGSSPAQASSLELFKHAKRELIKGEYPGLTEDE